MYVGSFSRIWMLRIVNQAIPKNRETKGVTLMEMFVIKYGVSSEWRRQKFYISQIR